MRMAGNGGSLISVRRRAHTQTTETGNNMTALTDLLTAVFEILVRGNHNTDLFAPNFYSPVVHLSDDRLRVTYSLEHGHLVTVAASMMTTDDGATLVGGHVTVNGEVTKDSGWNMVHEGADPRMAMLNEAANLDALFGEFILVQVLRELEA